MLYLMKINIYISPPSLQNTILLDVLPNPTDMEEHEEPQIRKSSVRKE